MAERSVSCHSERLEVGALTVIGIHDVKRRTYYLFTSQNFSSDVHGLEDAGSVGPQNDWK